MSGGGGREPRIVWGLQISGHQQYPYTRLDRIGLVCEDLRCVSEGYRLVDIYFSHQYPLTRLN